MLIQNLHIECCFVLLFTVYEYSQYKIFLLIMKTQMCLVFMSKLIKLKDNNFSPILSCNTLKLIFEFNLTPILFLMVEKCFPSSKIVIFICHTYIFGQKTKKLFKNWKNGGLWRPSWISSDGHKMKTYYPIWKIKPVLIMFFSHY